MAPIGFAAHESYLHWLEVGRSDLLKNSGIDYREIEKTGRFLPVLEWHMRFRKPIFYGDALTLITLLRDRPPLKFRLDYQILRENKVVAFGHTLQGFVNRQGRPTRPPDSFVEMVAQEFDRGDCAQLGTGKNS